MEGKKNTIAVFDLDGTITFKDTYLEFIKYAKGNLKYYFGLILLSPFIISYYLKLIPNYRLKEFFFSYYFKGKAYNDIKKIGDEFSENEIPRLIRKAAYHVIEWHKSNNHVILILSASADIWLRKWCDINNFQLICTQFDVENEKLTGKLKGKNCYGDEKRVLLEDYFKKQLFEFSYGYGDSSSDRSFLKLVDEPYLMALDDKNVNRLWKPSETK